MVENNFLNIKKFFLEVSVFLYVQMFIFGLYMFIMILLKNLCLLLEEKIHATESKDPRVAHLIHVM